MMQPTFLEDERGIFVTEDTQQKAKRVLEVLTRKRWFLDHPEENLLRLVANVPKTEGLARPEVGAWFSVPGQVVRNQFKLLTALFERAETINARLDKDL